MFKKVDLKIFLLKFTGVTDDGQDKNSKKIGSGFSAKSEPFEVLDGSNLDNKIAVVTGGYSGIELETTRALASKIFLKSWAYGL